MSPVPLVNWSALSPLLILASVGVALLLVEAIAGSASESATRQHARARAALVGVAVMALVISFFLSWNHFEVTTYATFQLNRPLLRIDRLSAFSMCLVSASALVCCLLSLGEPGQSRVRREFYGVLLIASAGTGVLVSATHLLSFFLGLELVGLCAVATIGLTDSSRGDLSVTLRAALTGAVATATALFGMALLYATSGALDFAGVRDALASVDRRDPLAQLGAALALVGVASRLGLVPFHLWRAEVIGKAPTSVAALFATTFIVAWVAGLLRLSTDAFAAGEEGSGLPDVFSLLAAASLSVGAMMVLVERSLPRLIHYALVGQAGLWMTGFAVGSREAYAAVLLSLVAWSISVLGVFAIWIAALSREADEDFEAGISGLAKRRPWVAAGLSLCLLSLAGLPGTVGFLGKFQILLAALTGGAFGLVALALLASATTAYVFLRACLSMYATTSEAKAQRPVTSGEALVIASCSLLVLMLGLFPNSDPFDTGIWFRILDWTQASVAFLF